MQFPKKVLAATGWLDTVYATLLAILLITMVYVGATAFKTVDSWERVVADQSVWLFIALQLLIVAVPVCALLLAGHKIESVKRHNAQTEKLHLLQVAEWLWVTRGIKVRPSDVSKLHQADGITGQDTKGRGVMVRISTDTVTGLVTVHQSPIRRRFISKIF